MNIDLNIFL